MPLELEEDEIKHGRRILAGFKIGVRTEIVGGAPEIVFKLFELFFGHFYQ